MTNYTVIFRGEDGTEFAKVISATSLKEAEYAAWEDYPEATVQEVFDPIEKAKRVYDRQQAIYDNPDLDDYGY